MDKITNISMAVSAQQDKNHATFQIECEGQMHQLRAQNEAEMRRLAPVDHDQVSNSHKKIFYPFDLKVVE